VDAVLLERTLEAVEVRLVADVVVYKLGYEFTFCELLKCQVQGRAVEERAAQELAVEVRPMSTKRHHRYCCKLNSQWLFTAFFLGCEGGGCGGGGGGKNISSSVCIMSLAEFHLTVACHFVFLL
jgi:hypothetical protein